MPRREPPIVSTAVRERYQAGWGEGGHATAETLNARVDGELTPADNEAVASHLDGCGTCLASQRDTGDLRLTVSRLLNALEAEPIATTTTVETLRRAPMTAPHPTRANATAVSVAGLAHVGHRRFRTAVQLVGGAAVVLGGAAYSIAHVGVAAPPAPTMSLDSAIAMQRKGTLPANAPSAVVKVVTHTPYVVTGTVHTLEPRVNGVPKMGIQQIGIRNAVVYVDGRRGFVLTDDAGHFELGDVPKGATSIHIRALGFTPVTVPIDFSSDVTARVDVPLPREIRRLQPMMAAPAVKAR